MKKFLGILVLGLLWSNFAYSENQIYLKDLKLNQSINNYFSNQEIAKYNIQDFGYGSNSKYSLLMNISNKFKNNEYDSFTIAYATKSKKIAYYAAFVDGFKNLNECLNFRDEQVSKNRKKFILRKKKSFKSTHADGFIQEAISFKGTKTDAKFSCDYYEDQKFIRVDFRFDTLTMKFNEWVVKLEGTESSPN